MTTLDKGLLALGMFNPTRRLLRVVDVAKELSIPMSSASRLLKGLSDRGFLVATTNPRGYVPGFEISRIASIGSGHIDSSMQVLRKKLADLIRTTDYATGCIATLQGTDIQIVDIVDATAPVRLAVSSGTTLPAFVTAVGRALLMRQNENAIWRCYPPVLRYAPLKFVMSLSEFLILLSIYRERGWADLNDPGNRGVEALASSVRFHDGPLFGIATYFLEEHVGQRERDQLSRGLVEICAELGLENRDEFWMGRSVLRARDGSARMA